MTSRERAENAVRTWHETPSCGLNVCIASAIDAAVAEAKQGIWPPDQLKESYDRGYDAGRADERRACVAWLRANRQDHGGAFAIEQGDHIWIEQGDHIKPPAPKPRYEVRRYEHYESLTSTRTYIWCVWDREASVIQRVFDDEADATRGAERMNGGAS